MFVDSEIGSEIEYCLTRGVTSHDLKVLIAFLIEPKPTLAQVKGKMAVTTRLYKLCLYKYSHKHFRKLFNLAIIRELFRWFLESGQFEEFGRTDETISVDIELY